MWHSNITATRPIEYQLVFKDKIEKYTSLKLTKASPSKPNDKPPPGDKTLRIKPDIRFYEIEDGNNTEEGEELEILVICDKILMEN